MDNDQKRAQQQLWEKIKDVKFGMLTTIDERSDVLRSRPMTTQQEEFDGTLWFFTSEATAKDAEIRQHQKVNISYAKPDDQLFISVSGDAQIIDDREKARELWSPLYKAWFPQGLDDPDLRLIRVDVTAAEYWDSSSSKMVQLYAFAKSMVTGKPPSDVGEHARISHP